MSDDARRTTRVAGLIQARLGEILTRELGDAELMTTVITSVEIARDLSIAHVRVRRLGVGEPPGGRDAFHGIDAMEALLLARLADGPADVTTGPDHGTPQPMTDREER